MATEETSYSANFEPHAVILTERLIPQPIFVAAFIGVARLLRIDFHLTASPNTFVAQALDGLTKRLLEFDPSLSKAGFTPDLLRYRGVIQLLGDVFGDRFRPEAIRRRATLPSFGAATGFVVNFAPDHANRYDLDGHPVETLGRAKRLGSTSFTLSGRPLSGAELDSLFGNGEIMRMLTDSCVNGKRRNTDRVVSTRRSPNEIFEPICVGQKEHMITGLSITCLAKKIEFTNIFATL